MNLRGFLLTFFLLLSMLSHASVDSENAQIKDAVGLSLSDKGLRYFQDNLLKILESNGIETQFFYFEKMVHQFADNKAHALAKTQSEAQVVDDFKENFTKLFDGLVLNDHNLQLTLDGLFLETKWDNIGIDFFDPNLMESHSDRDYLAGLNLNIKASNIRFGVENNLLLEDLNNSWLGEVGVNRFLINSKKESPALNFMISIALYRDNDGRIAARVEKPETNFNQLALDLDYEEGSLKFPDISIKVNEKEFTLNRGKIESWFNNEEEKFLNDFQNLVQNYLTKNLDSLVADLIKTSIGNGLAMYNESTVPGADPEVETQPLVWGIFFDRLEYESDILSTVFNGSVFDLYEEGPSAGRRLIPAIKSPYTASEPIDLERHNIKDSDLTLYFNIELFNQFIQVGFDRGFLKSFELDDEASIEINAPPFLKYEEGRIKMELDLFSKIGKNFTEKMVIKDKIRVKVDLFVELKVLDDGTVGLVFQEIDLESTEVMPDNIRWLGKFFTRKIRKKVDEQILAANKESLGRVLAKDIPIPNQLWGLPLAIKKISVDKAGYFLVETDFQLQGEVESL